MGLESVRESCSRCSAHTATASIISIQFKIIFTYLANTYKGGRMGIQNARPFAVCFILIICQGSRLCVTGLDHRHYIWSDGYWCVPFWGFFVPCLLLLIDYAWVLFTINALIITFNGAEEDRYFCKSFSCPFFSLLFVTFSFYFASLSHSLSSTFPGSGHGGSCRIHMLNTWVFDIYIFKICIFYE